MAAAVFLCLALAAAAAAGAHGALLLSRPEGECIAPALETLSYNFYPKSYQLQSINQPTSSNGLSTTVEFAEDFTVTYRGTYKVVVNKRVNETYLLYQCGSPNPLDLADTEVGLPASTKVFEIPLVSVSVDDSSASGFLAELGLVDRVAFANEYSYNSCLQTIKGCGNQAVSASGPVDYDSSPANDAAFNASVAEWKAAAAQQHPLVDAIFTNDASSNPKSIAVTSFNDPGVLNRAEWVKFVAVFFNKEVEANNLFAGIQSDYQRLNASARAAAAKAAAPTVVAWLSKDGDKASLNFATYKTQFITDAGGVVPSAADIAAAGGSRAASGASLNYNFNTSVPAQQQGLTNLLKEVDVIIDDSYAPGSSNFPDLDAFVAAYNLGAAASDIPAVANGRVWAPNNRLSAKNADGGVASDWFEGSIARPDLVLADFVQVITPAALPAGASVKWLRKLAGTNSTLAFSGPSGCNTVKCTRAAPARICPNAYRDCTTGELKTVTDPTARCNVAPACPDATPAPAAAGTAAATTKNAAHVAGAGVSQLLLALLAAAALYGAVL